MVRASRLLRASSLLVFAAALSSCAIFGAPEHCSDLEVGDQLLVTIREPLDEPACDPALGLAVGAELKLTVEDFGASSACSSAIGPVNLDGADLVYWPEASDQASGSAAFASVSRGVGPCGGELGLTLLPDESRSDAESDQFDTIGIIYQGRQDDPTCPDYCDVDYAVDVERL